MLTSITALWLPVLLATLLAWVASMFVHMVFKYHNADYRQLSNEDEVASAIRNGKPGKGIHTIPYCVDMKEMGSASMQEKFNKGPVSFVTVFDDGMPPMPKLVLQQILFFLFDVRLQIGNGLFHNPGRLNHLR